MTEEPLTTPDAIEVDATPAELSAMLAPVVDPAARWAAVCVAAADMVPILPEYMWLLYEHDDDNAQSTMAPIHELPLDQLELFFLALRMGNARGAAARAAGILPAQISALKSELQRPLPVTPHARVVAITRRQRIQEFFVEVSRVEAQVEQMLVGTVFDAATREKGPDVKAAQYLLERRFARDWAPAKTVIHAGKKSGDSDPNMRGGIVIHNNTLVDNRKMVAQLSNEDLEVIEARMRGAQSRVALPDGPAPRAHQLPGRVLTVDAPAISTLGDQ